MTTPDSELITDLLVRLVGAPSVNPPGNEAAAAAVLARFLDGHGIASTIDQVEPDRPNLIASIGSGAPRVLLTSHLDVVGPGEPARWDRDPFTAQIEDGMLYGRGACDAKGQVAAIVGALLVLAANPPCEVVLAAVMGEEKGGVGSKHFAAKDARFDAAVVGEPTRLGIGLGHAGRVGIALEFAGETRHPTRADGGANPVFHLAPVLRFMREFTDQVLRRQMGSFVVTEVSAGERQVLTPPQRCTVTTSWWFPPRMNHDDAIADFGARFDAFAESEGITCDVRYHRGAGACEIEPDHALVSAAGHAIEARTGTAPHMAPFPASCDMYVFSREGIPTIIFGPGDLDLAHAPNESIRLADVCTASEIHVDIVRALAAKR